MDATALALAGNQCDRSRTRLENGRCRGQDFWRKSFNQAGPEKILFGTDAPWLHPGVELSKIWQLRLKHPEQDLQKILSGNFLKLANTARAMQTA